MLKIDLVWAVKSSKKYIENGKRALSHIKTLIKHVFLLFYLHELLMSFWMVVFSRLTLKIGYRTLVFRWWCFRKKMKRNTLVNSVYLSFCIFQINPPNTKYCKYEEQVVDCVDVQIHDRPPACSMGQNIYIDDCKKSNFSLIILWFTGLIVAACTLWLLSGRTESVITDNPETCLMIAINGQ